MVANLNTLNTKFQSQSQIQNRNVNGTEVTQELLDDYAESIGYERGYVSLELFNVVMDDYEGLLNNNIDYVVDSKPFNEFTKDKMKEINNTHSKLTDLYNEEFDDLPENEKEQLIYLNTLAEDAENMNEQQRSQFWDGFTSSMVGFGAGTLLCGLGCGVLGFFIGGFINAISK